MKTPGCRQSTFRGLVPGPANEIQSLTVTASSSSTLLIPNPAVSYSSPSSTGSLTFTPAPNAYGSATITVTVNDGGASNNLVTRFLCGHVNPVNQAADAQLAGQPHDQ